MACTGLQHKACHYVKNNIKLLERRNGRSEDVFLRAFLPLPIEDRGILPKILMKNEIDYGKETADIQENRANRILRQLGVGDIISVPAYEKEGSGRTGTIKKFHQHLVELVDNDGHTFFIQLNRFKAQNINVIFSSPDKDFEEMYDSFVQKWM